MNKLSARYEREREVVSILLVLEETTSVSLKVAEATGGLKYPRYNSFQDGECMI